MQDSYPYDRAHFLQKNTRKFDKACLARSDCCHLRLCWLAIVITKGSVVTHKGIKNKEATGACSSKRHQKTHKFPKDRLRTAVRGGLRFWQPALVALQSISGRKLPARAFCLYQKFSRIILSQ